MQTRWLTMIMLAGATGTASAQLPKVPFLGLFLGGTEAQVDGSGVTDISNRTGVAFGAYGVIPIDRTWAAEPGAFYSMRGWKRVEPGTGDESTVKLNYFEIPLLMRVNIGPSTAPSLFGAFIKGGFGLGFRATCSIETKDASSNVTASASCDDIEAASNGTVKFRSFDVGAIIGGGVSRRVGRQYLVLSAQYDLGLSKIQEGNDIANRTLTFGVALEMPVRR